jgi:hypothetical protein
MSVFSYDCIVSAGPLLLSAQYIICVNCPNLNMLSLAKRMAAAVSSSRETEVMSVCFIYLGRTSFGIEVCILKSSKGMYCM